MSEMLYAPMWEDRIGLFDADLILYACGYVADKEKMDKAGACSLFDEMLLNIRHTLELTGGKFFLSDNMENNFRYKVATTHPYKAGRKEREKPQHHEAIKAHCKKKWKAKITKGMEADDGMGRAQTKSTVICSIDKDMDMIPGWHYNWKRYSLYHVTPWQAKITFWTQMITGDSVDNIKGIYGLGPKKVAKLFEGKQSEIELYAEVVKQYCEHFKDDARSRFEENYDLLCIKGAPVGFRDEPEYEVKEIVTNWGG